MKEKLLETALTLIQPQESVAQEFSRKRDELAATLALKPYVGAHYIESLDALEIELMSK